MAVVYDYCERSKVRGVVRRCDADTVIRVSNPVESQNFVYRSIESLPGLHPLRTPNQHQAHLNQSYNRTFSIPPNHHQKITPPSIPHQKLH